MNNQYVPLVGAFCLDRLHDVPKQDQRTVPALLLGQH